MYRVDDRAWPMVLHVADVPQSWTLASALQRTTQGEFEAENYDRLVDSPVEVGPFHESDFEESGGDYRVVVDADPSDYDMQKGVAAVRPVVAAGNGWMDWWPFNNYLFFFHFSLEPV